MEHQDSWKLRLLANWPEIIGNLHDKVTVEKISKDTITLGVFDSSWMHELYILSPILLKTINKKLDQPRIKNVRFQRTVRKKRKIVLHKKKAAPIKEITLKPWEKNALNDVPDQALRAVLKSFLVRCHQEKK